MVSRSSRLLRSAKRATKDFPWLPAGVTLMLVGCSIFASWEGRSPAVQPVRHPGSAVASRELRSTLPQGSETPKASLTVPAPKAPTSKDTHDTPNCTITTRPARAVILKPLPMRNLKESAMACASSCRQSSASSAIPHSTGGRPNLLRQHPECNSWRWCEDHFNCKDEFGGILPYYGCQLRKEFPQPSGLPSNRSSELRRLIPRQSTSGYVQRLREGQTTFLRMQSAPLVKMMITTYNPSAECTTPRGSQITQMGIQNKRDYAKWHHYLFSLVTRTEDKSLKKIQSPLEGAWNKIGILNKLLRAYKPKDVEWILWMEPDAIFDNPAFTFPFEHYQGRDIVTVADLEKVKAGDINAMSTGILLVRNTEWAKDFFERVAEIARKNEDEIDPPASDPVAYAMLQVMQSIGLEDAIKRIRFEGEFCLACDWRRIDIAKASITKTTRVWGEANENWKLFVTRFFDCEMCWPNPTDAATVFSKCTAAFQKHYEFAHCKLSRMAKAMEREQHEGSLLQKLDTMDIPSKGLDIEAFTHPNTSSSVLLTNPILFKMNTSQDCYEACLMNRRCNAWVWCDEQSGCDEAGTYRDTFPYGGCRLTSTNPLSNPYGWYHGPQYATFSSGVIPENHPSKLTLKEKMSWGPSRATDRIVIASGLPMAPCMTPHGDALIRNTVQNKQDYARLHAYEFHNMGHVIDTSIRIGAWQKMGLLQKLLREIPSTRAEWIMWMDMDTVIQDMEFVIPLSKYTGHDFVVWGNINHILEGDVYNGINTGIFLVRNTEWSRNFIDETLPFGAFPPNHTYDEMLRDNIKNYDIGMFEQNVITYLAMKQPRTAEKLYFENKFCINCWYKDLGLPEVKHPPFIVHFAGCQTCTGLHLEKLDLCDRELLRVYLESHSSLRNIVDKRNSGVATDRKKAIKA